MKKLICYLCALVMIFATFAVPAYAVEGYSDVSADAWYVDAVEYMTQKGLMNGTGDGLFSPDLTTSRAMVVGVLYRLADEPGYSKAYPYYFVDVNINTIGEIWYTEAAMWAEGEGITNGYILNPDYQGEPTGYCNAVFLGDNAVTREELACFLYRYKDYAEIDYLPGISDLKGFADKDQVGDWAAEAMGWCVDRGIINGIPENGSYYLAPQKEATRAEFAAMLMRFAEIVDPLHNCNVLYVEADCDFTITNAKGETLTFSPEDASGPYGTMYCYGVNFTVPDVVWMFCVNYSESFTIEAEEGGVIESFDATRGSETIIK